MNDRQHALAAVATTPEPDFLGKSKPLGSRRFRRWLFTRTFFVSFFQVEIAAVMSEGAKQFRKALNEEITARRKVDEALKLLPPESKKRFSRQYPRG